MDQDVIDLMENRKIPVYLIEEDWPGGNGL